MSQQPLPREYRVTGTVPAPPQPIQKLPVQQPKKTEAGFPGLDAATSFWILLAMHGIIIAGEVYLAYRAGWLKF
jgi:hypothetical protein